MPSNYGLLSAKTKNGRLRAHLVTILARADINFALLHQPYPSCQSTIEQSIKCNRNSSVMFRRVPAELVVPVEAGGAERECRVAKAKANVGQGVRLFELQRVQVVGYRIVGGVLEV